MSSGGSIWAILGNVAGQIVRALLRKQSPARDVNASPTPGSPSVVLKKPKPQIARSKPDASTKPQATKPRSGDDLVASRASELAARERLVEGDPSPGQLGNTATIEIEPPTALTISYAPEHDNAPDAGEIVWTWIPYEEADGRGKDRPVLVVGRQSAERVYVVRLTSKSHDGERDFISIGSGAWDAQGRESWLDIDQVYSVHERGMRREAATLDHDRFATVAQALVRRYRWTIAKS